MKGILPCVLHVGIVEAKLDIPYRGVHSSGLELSSLEFRPFHCLSNPINPIVDWLG